MPNENIPLLTEERVKFLPKIKSKKLVFDELASLLAEGQSDISNEAIFDALIAREKLGSTCLGNGIAIPRARVTLTRARSAVLVLKQGIQLDAMDKQAIRIFYAILLPKQNPEKSNDMLNDLQLLLKQEDILEGIANLTNPSLLVNFFESLQQKQNKASCTL